MNDMHRQPSFGRPAIGVDQTILAENRALLRTIERRKVLKGTFSLGAVTLLGGCDVVNRPKVQGFLQAVSHFNDRFQAWLQSPTRLAPEFPASAVLKPPRFNAYIGRDQIPEVDASSWRLELAGLFTDKRARTLAEIDAMPKATMRTRHVCVEGWDYIGEWSGVPFRRFLESAGADLTAPYVAFRCADGYHGSIDMATALHPQTQLTTHYAGERIDRWAGFPIRLKTPLKLGFKQPKQIVSIEVTRAYPGGYWEERGFNWFSGL